MTPPMLTAESFNAYPPEGRELAHRYLEVLRSIPLAVLPGFLEQIQSYDWRFPQEQTVLTTQLEWLKNANAEERGRLLLPFTGVTLPPDLTARDWVNDPKGFTQGLSAHLWQSRQIDSYRVAAIALFHALPAPPTPSQAALVVAVIGRNAQVSSYPLFMRIRKHGLYVRNLSTENASGVLLRVLANRAQAAPDSYAHWYIDGGNAWPLPKDASESITHFTYPQLAPINDAVLKAMDDAVRQGTGPEILEFRLSHLSPEALGAAQATTDPRLQHLFASLLTVGTGTQIYSTSFVQAAAVEILRRAHPSTLYFRFSPRRRQASINDMVEARSVSPEEDPEGSLVDADMAAYYAYLELAKLPGGERASFVVWVEGRTDALVIGPNVTKDAESMTPLSMEELISLALT